MRNVDYQLICKSVIVYFTTYLSPKVRVIILNLQRPTHLSNTSRLLADQAYLFLYISYGIILGIIDPNSPHSSHMESLQLRKGYRLMINDTDGSRTSSKIAKEV
jgi:hypothetical protein